MILGFENIILVSHDGHNVGIVIVAPGKFDVHLEFLHDFSDVPAASADKPRVDPGVDEDFLLYHFVQFIDDLHDVLFRLVGVLFIAGDGDYVLFWVT